MHVRALLSITVALVLFAPWGRADLSGFIAPTTPVSANTSNPHVQADLIRLSTVGEGNSASSVTFNDPQIINAGWSASFTYSVVKQEDGNLADGFAFVLHNSTTLLGNVGGSVGYGSTGPTAFSPSFAFVVRTFSGGDPGFAIGTNGTIGSSQNAPGIDVFSAEPIGVLMNHYPIGGFLDVTLTQGNRTRVLRYEGIDIESIVGSPTAKVSFTGGTGGLTQTTTISSFEFAEKSSPSIGIVHAGVINRETDHGYARFLFTGKSVTGYLVLNANRYNIAGRLDEHGRLTRDLKTKGLPDIPVTVHTKDCGAEIMVQYIANDAGVARLKPAASGAAGRITAVLTSGNMPDLSFGTGFGVGTFNKKGLGKIVGRTQDNVPFSAVLVANASLQSDIYVPLYKKGGYLAGTIGVPREVGQSSAGQVDHFRPAGFGTEYPAGFDVGYSTGSSFYQKPESGDPVILVSPPNSANVNASFSASGEGLPPITSDCLLSGKAAIGFPAGAKIKATVNRATGLFKGLFINPDTDQRVKFQGVFRPPVGVGAGVFSGPSGAGDVRIEAFAPN